MHNLGLGDLEFDPGHTVDQHRPDGFRVPDIDVADDNEHIKHTHITGDSIDIKTKEDTSKSSDGKPQTTTTDKNNLSAEATATEYLNTLTWKAEDFEDVSFASLHNPKHVHHKPHSHGEYLLMIADFSGIFQREIC